MDLNSYIYLMPCEIIDYICYFLHYGDCAILGLTCKHLFDQIDYDKLLTKFIHDVEKVKLDGLNIKNITYQTERLCSIAVKQNGYALKYIKNQTEQICLEAVKQNGNMLQYVKNQTEQICIIAVKQNGHLLQYVKNQTEQICLEAIKQTKYALKYVTKETKQNAFALPYINFCHKKN